MQTNQIQTLLNDLILREGGYVNNPSDRGGPTKWGITLTTLSRWRGYTCTIEDIQNLPQSEAREIYTHIYITQPRFDQINDPLLRELVIDIGVNSGTRTATKLLQKAAGTTPDGIIGPKTLAKVNHPGTSLTVLYLNLMALRIQHLGRIITDDPTQAKNAAGWLNRYSTFLTKLSTKF